MRIAMIHPSLWGRGGAERQLLKLAVELQKMGHEPEIFTDAVSDRCYPELRKNLTVHVIPHPLWRLHRSLGWQATSSMISEERTGKKQISQIDRIMKKMLLQQYYAKELPLMLNLGKSIPKGFDLINNHNFPSEWAAFIAKRKQKVPIVWMCNGPPTWFLTKARSKISTLYWPLFEVFDRTAVQYIDEIVTLSDALARDVKKAYDKPTRLVRTGVDADFFHEAKGESLRRAHGLEKSFVLLQVGNIGQVRRNIDSIKILEYLCHRYDKVKLILDGYGSASQIDELRGLAQMLGLKDNLIIQHTQTDKELAQVYAASDVFIYPSHAPWSLAVTEAMAASKPVIIPKESGVSEIITNGINGVVMDKAKVEETAKQIESLINDPSLRRKIGENAYKYVKNNLSWEQYAKSMENIFEETMSNFKKGN
jgi:glycosyltransferase involved in cell wall biosynthesis